MGTECITTMEFLVGHIAGTNQFGRPTRLKIAKGALLALLLCLGSGSAFCAEPTVWSADPMIKVWQDRPVTEYGQSGVISISAARRENALFQVVVSAKEAGFDGVTVEVGALSGAGQAVIPATSIRLWRVGYLPVPKEAHIFQSGTGLCPDILMPLREPFDIKPNQNQSVFGEVAVPADAVPGKHTGQVTVKIGKATHTLPLALNVFPFTLPLETHFPNSFGAYRHMVTDYYGFKADDPKVNLMMKRMENLLLDHRLFMEATNSFRDLDTPEVIEYINDPRVPVFTLPFPMYSIARHLENLETSCARLSETVKVARERGLLRKGVVHPVDEVAWQNNPETRKICAAIHQVDPQLPIMVALCRSYDPELAKDVNIQVADIAWVDDTIVREIEALGVTPWWYSCNVPMPPFPSYQLNAPMMSPRMLSWCQRRYRVRGNLYWNINIWQRYENGKWVKTDPFVDPFNNGSADRRDLCEGRLVYPGGTAADPVPYPSLRLKAIGKGQDDLEYLWLAEQVAAQALARLGVKSEEMSAAEVVRCWAASIAPTLTDWTQDPRLLDLTRQELANFIATGLEPPLLVATFSAHDGRPKPETGLTVVGYTEPGAKLLMDDLYPMYVRPDGKFHLSQQFNYVNRSTCESLTVEKDGRKKKIALYFPISYSFSGK